MYFTLFWTYFKIGLFTFGGGYAMIPLIRRYIVEDFKWITEDEFFDILTIAESTPGPVAINSATYIGYKVKGVKGSIVATIGVSIPSIVVILLISSVFLQFQENVHVQYVFQGIRIGVSVLILNAGLRLYKKLDKNWFTYVLIVIGFGMLLFNVLSVIYVIMIGAALGIIYQLLYLRGEHDAS